MDIDSFIKNYEAWYSASAGLLWIITALIALVGTIAGVWAVKVAKRQIKQQQYVTMTNIQRCKEKSKGNSKKFGRLLTKNGVVYTQLTDGLFLIDEAAAIRPFNGKFITHTIEVRL